MEFEFSNTLQIVCENYLLCLRVLIMGIFTKWKRNCFIKVSGLSTRTNWEAEIVLKRPHFMLNTAEWKNKTNWLHMATSFCLEQFSYLSFQSVSLTRNNATAAGLGPKSYGMSLIFVVGLIIPQGYIPRTGTPREVSARLWETISVGKYYFKRPL